MANAITLYAYPFRSRAERVLWTLNELGLTFDLIRLSPFEGEQVNPALLKLNPDGKVPILVHQDRVFLESLAIMEYLNAISDTQHLVPTDVTLHYAFRKKLHYGLTEIEPYLWLAEQANGPLQRLYRWPPGVYAQSIARVQISCQALEALLGGQEFMLSSGFSLADIYFYHVITWAKQHGVQPAQGIEAYLSSLEQRSAFPQEMYWQSRTH